MDEEELKEFLATHPPVRSVVDIVEGTWKGKQGVVTHVKKNGAIIMFCLPYRSHCVRNGAWQGSVERGRLDSMHDEIKSP